MGKKKRPKIISRLRSVPFAQRLTAEEKSAFDDAAALAGLSTSAWVRERLRTTAAKELRDAGKPVAFFK